LQKYPNTKNAALLKAGGGFVVNPFELTSVCSRRADLLRHRRFCKQTGRMSGIRHNHQKLRSFSGHEF